MNKHYNKIYFQGKKEKNNSKYFEGWYYKQVKKDSSFTISFIPGVSYNKKDPHAFIQCIICNEKQELSSHYFRYKLSQFKFSNFPFIVKIGNSTFCKDYILVDLKDNKIKVSGKLKFSNTTPLRHSLFNPNIMGYFSYIPKMECNHHIISMSHTILGQLRINDEIIDLTSGIGYMEKDWGTSFPNEYIWLQCNHFEDSRVKLALSVANIPFLGFSFKGFFCSLIIGDNQYRFATYNRSILNINSTGKDNFQANFKKGKLSLDVSAEVERVQSLASPKNGVMNNSIKEGLAGKVSIVFVDKSNNTKVETTGINAGIEIMMNI